VPVAGVPVALRLAGLRERAMGLRVLSAAVAPHDHVIPRPYTEDAAVEKPAIELFGELGWHHINAYHERLGADGALGRETRHEVFLRQRLREAVVRLNPDATAQAVDQAIDEITKDRSALHLARANREVHELLRDRVPVSIRKPDGSRHTKRLTVIDWDNPGNNDFLLVSQLWVKSDLYERRTDLLGFVNGIPLVFIELKAAHRNLKRAYDENLTDYRDTIPHVFAANGFIVLSNGAETKVGTITSPWEHFLEWKKINSEGRKAGSPLRRSSEECAHPNDSSTSSGTSRSSRNCQVGWSSWLRATTSTSV